jgi:heme-degrading monooxygenase HmoA
VILTVFRSRLKDEARDQYTTLAPRISGLAKTMPGYLSHKTFIAEDGERVTIVEFADQASQRNWSTNEEHMAAMKLGRSSFYADYSIQVCTVVRESRLSPEKP